MYSKTCVDPNRLSEAYLSEVVSVGKRVVVWSLDCLNCGWMVVCAGGMVGVLV